MRRMMLLCLILTACAESPPQTPFEQMKRQTLWVRVLIETSSGRQLGGGSGFLIDDRHLVTNYHVCCQGVAGERGRTLFVHRSNEDYVEASVKWKSRTKDLSVLELKEAPGRPQVVFAPRRLCSDGQRIFAVGYPGAANLGEEANQRIPKISDGIISAMLQAPKEDRILGGGTRLYQTSAGINPGNSGGPIFDQCGRVTAVVSAKSASGEAIAWGIQVDELLDELAALNLSAAVATRPCSPEAGGSLGAGRLILLGLTTVLLLAAAARRRQIVPAAIAAIARFRRRFASSPAPKPVLRGLGGPYAGAALELDGRRLWLGRDGRVADLVVPAAGEISRRHCRLQFDAGRQVFLLEDAWSSNGTFLAPSGERLEAGRQRALKAGERFFLAQPEFLFEVSLEERP